MSIHDRSNGARVPRKPLRQEEVLRRPVDVRHRRVPQRVEVVATVEAGSLLPPGKSPLGKVCPVKEGPCGLQEADLHLAQR